MCHWDVKQTLIKCGWRKRALRKSRSNTTSSVAQVAACQCVSMLINSFYITLIRCLGLWAKIVFCFHRVSAPVILNACNWCPCHIWSYHLPLRCCFSFQLWMPGYSIKWWLPNLNQIAWNAWHFFSLKVPCQGTDSLRNIFGSQAWCYPLIYCPPPPYLFSGWRVILQDGCPTC